MSASTARRTVVLGGTARYARRLARVAGLRCVACAGAAGLAVFAAARFVSSDPAAAVLCVLVAAGAGFAASRFQVRWAQAAAGVRAEERVASTIRRSGPVALVNGMSIGRGDVDHVVLGPCCVAVETKAGRGVLAVDASGRLHVGGRVLPRDPLGQAAAAAAQVSRLVGRSAVAVLVVVDADGPPVRAGSVTVCSRRDLPAVLAACPPVFDAATAEAAARRLPLPAD